MGATQSKSVSANKIVNEAITDILVSSSASCGATQSAEQSLTFSDIKTNGCKVRWSDISQDARLETNFTCAQDTSQDAELANKFKKTLDNQVEASIKGLNIGLSNVETETKNDILNRIATNINMSNIASCVAGSLGKQRMAYDRIEIDCEGADDKTVTFDNISQKLTAHQVTKCVQSNKQASEAVNELQSFIQNKQKSSAVGLDLNALLGAWMIPVMLSVVCCIVTVSIAGSVLMYAGDIFMSPEGQSVVRAAMADRGMGSQ